MEPGVDLTPRDLAKAIGLWIAAFAITFVVGTGLFGGILYILSSLTR